MASDDMLRKGYGKARKKMGYSPKASSKTHGMDMTAALGKSGKKKGMRPARKT